MKKHIYLIGFMGTGKSTVSKALHELLSWKEVDMDARIEDEQQMKISDIFAKYGEAYFRDLETACFIAIAKEDAGIISCGGGAVLRQENVAYMKETGTIVLLTATPETVFSRVKHSTNRPILNGNMNVEYISQLMEKRHNAYVSVCDIAVETDKKTPMTIAREILSAIDNTMIDIDTVPMD